MIWIHRALVALAFSAMALAAMYAVRALTGKPHRARRATRAAIPAFLLLAANAAGRIPIALAAAEASGNARTIGWALAGVLFRDLLPVLLWGIALLGRWRGWLADTVFAASVLIAAALTVVFYLVF